MRKIVSFFCLLALYIPLSAQEVKVNGTVTDAGGAAIQNASIRVKGAGTGTAANGKGVFNLSARQGDTIVVSAAGYRPYEMVLTGEGPFMIRLDRQDDALSEVVVTALGIQRQKKELGYATARIASTELTQAAPVNAATGLQGKVSGLNVTSINNGVFAEVKINLRGIRSLTGNNNPMLLLDGIQTPLGYLSSVNPNDIQDINVLKGASGAALYGPDARNGVIVVTTKKGARGGNPVITLSQTFQLEEISFFPKFQHSFGSGGFGAYIPYENWSWGDAYDGSMREVGRPLEDGSVQRLKYSPLTNERKDFFNTGVTSQTDLSFAVKDFYLSVQDARIKGIVPHDENRRTGIRLNTAREYGKFRAGVNVNYIQQNYDIFDNKQMSDYHIGLGTGLNDGLMNLIFNTPAHIPIRSYKDFENNKFADFNGYFNDYGLNPYFAIDNWRQKGRNDDLLANIDLSLKATSWLNLVYRAGIAVNSLTADGTSKGEVASEYAITQRNFVNVPGAYSQVSQRTSRLSSEFFANFNKTYRDFRVTAIAGHYFRQGDARDSRVSTGNLVVPELFNLSNRRGELSGSSAMARTRLMSLYGSVGLGYKGWANIELTGRNDWTSVLSTQNNSFFYPGVSASLVLSDVIEPVKNSALISYLKLRASWNKTGNADIAPYSLQAIYAQANGFPYGSLPGYTAGNIAYDPNLKPEFIESREAGFELGLLNNRVNFELAWYNQDNTNQIIPVRVSDATGYTSSFVNSASFVNRGVEMDLRLNRIARFRKGSIDFKVNASYNDSEVKEIYSGLDQIFTGGYDNFAGNYAIAGRPAFVFRATDYLRDEQGRVIVSRSTGLPQVDPNTKEFGRTMPLWIVGLNPSVNWNGLSLTVVAEYRGGHYAYHNLGPDMAWTGVSAASARNGRQPFVFPNSVYDDGTGKFVENKDVVVPDANNFFIGVYRETASNFLTRADSWRIREVSLSYNVPIGLLGRQQVLKAATVTLNARNLALWLPKSNEYTDPDFNFDSGNSSGVNNSQINPPTRIYGANITLTF